MSDDRPLETWVQEVRWFQKRNLKSWRWGENFARLDQVTDEELAALLRSTTCSTRRGAINILARRLVWPEEPVRECLARALATAKPPPRVVPGLAREPRSNGAPEGLAKLLDMSAPVSEPEIDIDVDVEVEEQPPPAPEHARAERFGDGWVIRASSEWPPKRAWDFGEAPSRRQALKQLKHLKLADVATHGVQHDDPVER